MKPYSFTKSQDLFARAGQCHPQRHLRPPAPMMLVPGAYPYFFDRGDGAHVWDVDGTSTSTTCARTARS